MLHGMPAFCGVVFPLLLASAAAAVNQQLRQSNFRQQRGAGAYNQPSLADQEALTREDILTQGSTVPQSMPSAIAPALSISAPQQPPPAMPVPTYQAAQLLQAQAKQMEEMQQQLQKQQQELQRLQQVEKQHVQQQTPPPVHQSPKAQVPEQTPKKSLVGVGSAVKTHTETQTGMAGRTTPKGWDQCLKFARFVKTQDVTGVELVRVWKSTCEPAVQSGRATERYKLMCNSLSGVVEPYAAQIDYDVEQLCDAVLAVFHDVTASDVRAR